MKIWPMPKVEFNLIELTAKCMDKNFCLADNAEYFLVINDLEDDWHCYDRKNQTFEQAVTAWVESWVKENFPPIVVPDIKKSLPNQSEHISYRIDGWNDCVGLIGVLNPNCIRGDV